MNERVFRQEERRMNEHRASALRHYEAQVRRLFGVKQFTLAARFRRFNRLPHPAKPSGAQRRFLLRFNVQRFDRATRVWRHPLAQALAWPIVLNEKPGRARRVGRALAPHRRVARGNARRNPTAL